MGNIQKSAKGGETVHDLLVNGISDSAMDIYERSGRSMTLKEMVRTTIELTLQSQSEEPEDIPPREIWTDGPHTDCTIEAQATQGEQ
jgi:hypothetical protein